MHRSTGWICRLLVAALVATGAAALSAPAAAAVYAPPTAPTADTLDAEIDRASRAHGIVDFGPGPVRVDLLILDDRALLAVRSLSAARPQVYRIDDPGAAALVLADRRLAFAWPTLIDWAGSSLDKLRAQKLAETRAAFARGGDARADSATTPESSVRPRTRALLQHSSQLWHLGYCDEARRLLEAELAGNRRKSEWEKAEFAMVTISLATKLNNSGDHAAALALYDTVGRMESSYAINAEVNRAAILAETGQYIDALALIERSYAAYTAAPDGKFGHGHEKVPGSDRQFGWIRACALHGLGRTAEARDAVAGLFAEVDPDGKGFTVTSNSSLRLRARLCMRDVEGAVTDLIAAHGKAKVSSELIYLLQPALLPPGNVDQAIWMKVRGDPRLQALIADTMRVLPRELASALNGWSPAPRTLGGAPQP